MPDSCGMFDLASRLIHLDSYSNHGDTRRRLSPAQVKFLWNIGRSYGYGTAPFGFTGAEAAELVATAPMDAMPLPFYMSTLTYAYLPTYFTIGLDSSGFDEDETDLYMTARLIALHNRAALETPLSPETVAWLLEPRPCSREDMPLPRLALALHRGQADINARFDIHTQEGRQNLLYWFRTQDWPELGNHALPEWIAEARANGALPDAPARPKGRPPASGGYDPANEPVAEGPFEAGGANIVGWVRTPNGIGVDAQLAARAFRSAGVPYCIIDAARRLPPSPKQVDCGEEGAIVPVPRYDTDVVFLDAATQFRYHAIELLHGRTRTRRTIGVCPWELPDWPDATAFTLDTLDTLWAASRFIEGAFVRHLGPDRVVLAPPSVVIDENVRRPPPPLDGSAKMRFLTVFDGQSSLHRKNPMAVARAFREAFGARDDVELILKCMNMTPKSRGYDTLMEAIGADPRIRIVNETLDQRTVWELVASVHCVVSLHRSEGFGRNIAEAMLLERPVICSAFSGNMDFTSDSNAFLVGGEEVEVPVNQYAMSRGQKWFDASVEEAARQMVRVTDHYTDALERAALGRAHIAAHHSVEAAGRRYKALLAAG